MFEFLAFPDVQRFGLSSSRCLKEGTDPGSLTTLQRKLTHAVSGTGEARTTPVSALGGQRPQRLLPVFTSTRPGPRREQVQPPTPILGLTHGSRGIYQQAVSLAKVQTCRAPGGGGLCSDSDSILSKPWSLGLMRIWDPLHLRTPRGRRVWKRQEDGQTQTC